MVTTKSDYRPVGLGLHWGEGIGLRVCDINFPRRAATVAGIARGLARHRTLVPDVRTE